MARIHAPLLLAVCLSPFAALAAAQNPVGAAVSSAPPPRSAPVTRFQVPALTGPVVDGARLLDPGTAARLDRALRGLRAQGGAQIVVLTVDSLEGIPIEQVGIQAADAWKLGDRKRDDGVILLVSKIDRRVRIEVGRGLEGQIPDALANRIVEQAIVPYFKADRFSQGIFSGAYQIAHLANPDMDLAPLFGGGARGAPMHEKRLPGAMVFLLLGLIGFSMIFGNRFGGPRFGGGFGGGGFGGGGFGGGGGDSFGGGGGGFNGGGASGGW